MVALSEPLLFKPENYGITPIECSRSCYHGYWCDYTISDKRIVLESFYVNSKENYYPEINGIVPLRKDGRDVLDALGHHCYEGVNIKVGYTGKLVVGSDFLSEYHILFSRPYAWEYKDLKEFVFTDGNLTEVMDHSNVAEELRNQMREDVGFMEKFREKKFALDWWIYRGKYSETD